MTGWQPPPDPPTLADEQRQRFLDILEADNTTGLIAALRQAGVEGKRQHLRDMLDEELMEQAREARGWNINRVEGVIWEVALDKEHRNWFPAASFIAKAYAGSQFRDHVDHEHEHRARLEVTVEHDYDRLLDKLQQVGLLQRGPTAVIDAAAQPALPARTD